MKTAPIILAALLAAAALAAEAPGTADEITETPPELGFKAVKATCEEVLTPYLVRLEVLGDCALIGVTVMPKTDPYYGKALQFVKDRVAGKEVRVEVCPNIPQNSQGQNRVLVYYWNGDEWVNLSIDLIAAGLAKVADVPGCHVPTKGWLAIESGARKARLGLWATFKEPGAMKTDKPDLSDFE